MKIKSRVNGIIIEATSATSEILKLGSGKYAKAISDSAVAEDNGKKTTRKASTKAQQDKQDEIEKVKSEAKAAGIVIDESHIDGANKHDDEDAVEVL